MGVGIGQREQGGQKERKKNDDKMNKNERKKQKASGRLREKNGNGRFLENSYFNSRFLQRAGRKELKTYSVSKFSNLEYLK